MLHSNIIMTLYLAITAFSNYLRKYFYSYTNKFPVKLFINKHKKIEYIQIRYTRQEY